MPRRVVDCLCLSEAYTQGMCPHCGATEPAPKVKRRGTGDWLEGHLKRCKARPEDIKTGEILRTKKVRWAVHEDCGRVMVLEVHDGLALVENRARRYVVAARDLAIGGVATILEQVEALDLMPDEIQELIGHLLTMAKEVPIEPAVHAGNRIEFRCNGSIKRGLVKRRHGKHAYIVQPEDGTQGMNIAKRDIVHVIE